MHVFTQKLNASRHNDHSKSTRPTKPSRALGRHSPDVQTILHLQQTIGYQALQRFSRTRTEQLEARSASNATARIAHHFSRIAVHSGSSPHRSSTHYKIQPKLRVNAPGDISEQEADRIADQVTRMPGLREQRTCACGGESANCRVKQLGPNGALLRANSDQANDAGVTMAPPTVHHVLRSPGQPLDSTSKAYFESRFGYDFSKVRVHTDKRAAEAARQINARAFTHGTDIVLDAGEHRLDTQKGRHLVAHELTHVIQQNGKDTPVVQRQVSTYRFYDCTSGPQEEIIDRTIRHSYMLVEHAISALNEVIEAVFRQTEESELSVPAHGVVDAAGIEFGGGIDTLSTVRDKYGMIRDKYREGLNITCHNDPERNQVASALEPGNDIWLGPEFFNNQTDALISRPRIFIHEVAHNIGLSHAFPGVAFIAGQEGSVGAAEVAHGADSYALFAYRIYTQKYRDALGHNNDI